jgi:hypothetical protein
VIIGSSLVSTYVHDASRSTAPFDAPLIALASALTRQGTCTVGTGAASAADAVASPVTAAVPATIAVLMNFMRMNIPLYKSKAFWAISHRTPGCLPGIR